MAMARNTSAPGVSPWPRQLGFVAQEVQDALPRRGEGVVHEVDDAGHLGVSYSKLTVLLTGAAQEQQLAIDELKTKHQASEQTIDAQQATIDELKQASEHQVDELKAQLRVLQQASEREIAKLKQARESSEREIGELKAQQEAQRAEQAAMRLAVEQLLAAV